MGEQSSKNIGRLLYRQMVGTALGLAFGAEHDCREQPPAGRGQRKRTPTWPGGTTVPEAGLAQAGGCRNGDVFDTEQLPDVVGGEARWLPISRKESTIAMMSRRQESEGFMSVTRFVQRR